MPFTTLSIRIDVARKLKASKLAGESYSDVIDRLLDYQPAKTVDEWLKSLACIEGHGVLKPEERSRLRRDQRVPGRKRHRLPA
jgi:predicted CopG family antitoxin